MEQKLQAPQDLLRPLSELKSHGFDTLLQDLFRDLKVAGAPSQGSMLSLVLGGGRPEGRLGGARSTEQWQSRLACQRHGVGWP